MFGLGWTNWARLGGWLVIGLIIYFSYGQNHSRLSASAK
jgi:APA family basic amino acid/polyamine antiporter